MGKDTRHQHYVPQCYIQNFANPKNSKVAKYCFMQNCSFDDKAENICHKRDLYEWDKDNNMNQVEKRFSKYESGYSSRLEKFIFNCSKIKIEDGKSYKIKNGFQVLDFNSLLKDIIIQMLREPLIINNLPKILSDSYTAMGIDFSKNKVIQEATEEVKIMALKGVGLNTIFKENVDGISSEAIAHFYDVIYKTHRIVIYKSERLHFF